MEHQQSKVATSPKPQRELPPVRGGFENDMAFRFLEHDFIREINGVKGKAPYIKDRETEAIARQAKLIRAAEDVSEAKAGKMTAVSSMSSPPINMQDQEVNTTTSSADMDTMRPSPMSASNASPLVQSRLPRVVRRGLSHIAKSKKMPATIMEESALSLSAKPSIQQLRDDEGEPSESRPTAARIAANNDDPFREAFMSPRPAPPIPPLSAARAGKAPEARNIPALQHHVPLPHNNGSKAKEPIDTSPLVISTPTASHTSTPHDKNASLDEANKELTDHMQATADDLDKAIAATTSSEEETEFACNLANGLRLGADGLQRVRQARLQAIHAAAEAERIEEELTNNWVRLMSRLEGTSLGKKLAKRIPVKATSSA